MTDSPLPPEVQEAVERKRTVNNILNFIDGGALFRESIALFDYYDSTITSQQEEIERLRGENNLGCQWDSCSTANERDTLRAENERLRKVIDETAAIIKRRPDAMVGFLTVTHDILALSNKENK